MKKLLLLSMFALYCVGCDKPDMVNLKNITTAKSNSGRAITTAKSLNKITSDHDLELEQQAKDLE